MRYRNIQTLGRLVSGVAGVCLLLANASVLAEEMPSFEPIALDDTVGRAIHGQEASTPASYTPFPLAPNETSNSAGLEFEMAGSETRQLRLELSEPLQLDLQSGAWTTPTGGAAIGIDSELSWNISNGLSIGAGVSAGEQQIPFQTLGSIQCENGVLGPGSYTASGCQFVNQDNSSVRRADLTTRYQAPGGLTTSFSLFREEADVSLGTGAGMIRSGGSPMLSAGSLSPSLSNPLLGNAPGGQPLGLVDSELTGVDLQFALGMTTDRAGDVQLGLQLTRVLDANWGTQAQFGGGPMGWTLADPYDTATLNLDWSLGSFSTGFQSLYREPVAFLNRNELDAISTFDVHFTWRTPWNASLSVGASNVTNAGVDDSAEPGANDPFESVFGRIPYVRYKQDL